MEPTPSEPEIAYLRRIERLAHVVTEEAARLGWLTLGPEGAAAQGQLERAVNGLATELRFTHLDGDGCIDH